jgi:hypothetical protein
LTFAVSADSRSSGRGIIAVGLVCLIASGMVAAWISPDRLIDTAERLMDIVRGLGAPGAVVFAILQISVAACGILPASMLGAAAGAIYGLVPGLLLAAVGTLAGAMLSFFLSRSLFRPTAERLVARQPRRRPDRAEWLETSLPSAAIPDNAVRRHQPCAWPVRGGLACLRPWHACIIAGAVRLCIYRDAHGYKPFRVVDQCEPDPLDAAQ